MLASAPPSVTAPLLSMQGVTKRFDNVIALSGVCLEVRRGEVHAVCGENGAGKSTLMKILSGVYMPNDGEVRIDGEAVRIRGLVHAQALGIVMIHQELNLVPHLSVAENIWLGREPRRGLFIDRERQRDGARRCLERLGVAIDPDAQVSTLSIAQQQMVEIAKALSMDARLLIMDEPTSSLGEADAERLLQVVLELKRSGVGIVYISHRLDELGVITDRVTVLRDGQYIATRDWADTSIDEIVSLMVGRELTQQFPAATRMPGDQVLMQVRGLRRDGVFGPVDFELRRGEILGFAGLVGAGRTEVARALFGADPLDDGEVQLAGQRLALRTPRDAIAAGIAYVSEDRKAHGLAVKMSVAHNITLANLGALSGPLGFIDAAGERQTAERFIQQLAIRTPSPDQVARLLSGGNQQKIVIAKWLFREARIIIFDEPTRGIDVGAKYAIYELMDRLAAEGIGVILISSDLPEILGLTDRVAVFRQGRIARVLQTRECTQHDIIHHASVGGTGSAPEPEEAAPETTLHD
ncbi:sugar ABC transporter ATP-binding protein [Pelomonas sp. P8]|uniref:Sugar ABC transporter ATP-binding protein n=2 Tax=Pelomonas cellulosilytica TaxID=2906762 RepID=A0ABS8XZ36_9BURK|nr:sugar ABC transporter ATP-binding protein [Pelomonas sp. P8]MCE4557884.1 sugar ABC transporter ATP-binding protein [Pelomonas sp. P8]